MISETLATFRQIIRVSGVLLTPIGLAGWRSQAQTSFAQIGLLPRRLTDYQRAPRRANWSSPQGQNAETVDGGRRWRRCGRERQIVQSVDFGAVIADSVSVSQPPSVIGWRSRGRDRFTNQSATAIMDNAAQATDVV